MTFFKFNLFAIKIRARSMSPPKKSRLKFAMVDENSTKPVSNLIGFFEDKNENVVQVVFFFHKFYNTVFSK